MKIQITGKRMEGSSTVAAIVLARLRELGYEVEVEHRFEAKIVEDYAKEMDFSKLGGRQIQICSADLGLPVHDGV